ncbi:hypothetical protein ACFFIS_01350 [Virgibacillus soli]|uniref:Uncharacterized protein n=1 Tax=Paracerasibacillus soli TaxID=480284 RepID=A0ABU5CT34_9BACI|nr:hypothetical protein [Virgibacillus soli]MDY0409400.1 hypothetical protein [Virgibacillus soli]
MVEVLESMVEDSLSMVEVRESMVEDSFSMVEFRAPCGRRLTFHGRIPRALCGRCSCHVV